MDKEEQGLSQRSFRAAGWIFLFQFTNQFLHILFGIIMVRTLSPSDYGLIGMLTIFWSISNVFISGGLGFALIQKKEVTQLELTSVFYYNMFLAFIFSFLIMIFAPTIASFYNQPVLEKIIYVLAWMLPFGTLSSIQGIQLTRKFQQKGLTLAYMGGFLVSAPIAYYMATHGWGVWALVSLTCVSTFIRTIIILCVGRWLPSLAFSFKTLLELFRFGSGIFLSSLLESVFTNVYNIAIGKCYSPKELGYYERAFGYTLLWPTNISSVITNVLFPALSRLQDEPERLRLAFQRSLVMIAFVSFFPVILMGALAGAIVPLVLSDNWLPIIPYWNILTINALFYPVHYLNIFLLNAKGRSDLQFYLELIKKSFIILNVIFTYSHGIMVMIVGIVLVSFLSLVTNMIFTKRLIHYSCSQQFFDVFPSLLLAVAASLFAVVFNELISPISPWAGLFGAGIFGSICYIALARFFQLQVFFDLLTHIFNQVPLARKYFGFLLTAEKKE